MKKFEVLVETCLDCPAFQSGKEKYNVPHWCKISNKAIPINLDVLTQIPSWCELEDTSPILDSEYP